MLMDASTFGLSGAEFSKRLLEKGQVAATAMTGWGSKRSDQFVRFIFLMSQWNVYWGCVRESKLRQRFVDPRSGAPPRDGNG